MSYAIEMQQVSHRYKHFQLQSIDLKIETGTIMGIIGVNGAGKSTLLRIMMGMIRPDAGEVRVLGFPMPGEQSAAKWEVGFASLDMRLYGGASLAKHMLWMEKLYPKWDSAYAKDLLDRFDLVPERPIKVLSFGQAAKAILLLALARRPKLLILDEPTNGLDPVARHQIHQEMMRIVEDEERSIVFSSQNTEDVEQFCDSITFIDKGRVLSCSDSPSYLDRWRRLRLVWRSERKPECIERFIVERSSDRQAVVVSDRFEESVAEELSEAGCEVTAVERMTLEEIFICTVQNRDKVSS